MTFAAPYAFLLLLLLPVVWWAGRRRGKRRNRPAVRFSWTHDAANAGRSLRQRLSYLPRLLRVGALALLVTAVARPQKGLEQVREVNEGIAIEMVVDRSSSMGNEMMFEGRRADRLEVVKEVFKRFVLGDGDDLQGRGNDLIGMIAFARYADTVCPLTLAHGALPRFLDTVHLAQSRAEDGTAIGDAIALAAARLKTAEDVVAQQAPDRVDPYTIQSKIMILLTDGEQTAGNRDPLSAAKLAAEWGIKIYTVAVGGGEDIRGQNSIFGRFLRGTGRMSVDTATLKSVAEETGGQFFMAEDAGSLRDIYQEIDALERTEIQSVRFMDYKELFLPFAVAALAMAVLEFFLNCTVFRKVP